VKSIKLTAKEAYIIYKIEKSLENKENLQQATFLSQGN